VSAGGNGRHSWLWDGTDVPKDDPARFDCLGCGAGLADPIHYTDWEEELLAAGAPLTASERDFAIFKAARSLALARSPRVTLEGLETELRIILELVNDLEERE